ncbi:MAG: universal stress protein [Gelidibacter sp.]|uniref:universal stress protein n=1 Tax=Gelidibacter sp. TaxID=2018083 RepID=UPI0032630FDB
MRHHILLPTDFSENAWSAVLYALKLYNNKPCTFYFLHAWTFVNTGSRTYITPDYIDKLMDTSRAQLAALKERAIRESTNSEHEFKTIFTTDSLIDSIIYAVGKQKIDLLVMGTKGATGAKEFLWGSNSVSVINKVKLCPVMLVPDNYEFETPNQLGFPTDFNRLYGEELLAIKKLAALYHSAINILHINGMDKLTDTQRNNFDILKEYLKNDPHTFYWKSDYAKKAQAIKDFIKENKINILTMINYEHSFIEKLTKEPVINKMGFHSQIPFVVIPRIER